MKTIKITIAIMICFGCLIVSSVQAGYDEDVAAINKGMPKAVKLFNLRQIECNHWTGEEPYDEERVNEINTATTKLRCNDLEKDEKKLLKKYKLRTDVGKSINKAKEFY